MNQTAEEGASEQHKSFSSSSQQTSFTTNNKSKSLDLNGGSLLNANSMNPSGNSQEEDGDSIDVELPPPMKIQDHSYHDSSVLSSASGNGLSEKNIVSYFQLIFI